MIRWLGFLLVLIGSTAVGMQLSDGVRKEIRYYRDLQTALERMRWEISARLAPLPEAAMLAAQGVSVSVSSLFHQFSECVDAQPAEPVASLMLRAMAEQREPVPTEAKRVLLSLSTVLGMPDVSVQVRAIDRAAELLAARERALQAAQKTKTRSYQTLGVCAGLAIAILLV